MYTQLALCSLLTAVCAAPTPASFDESIVKVPVSRERHVVRATDDTVSAAWYFGTLKHTLQKYGKNPTFPFAVTGILAKRGAALEALKDEYTQGEDELYYGNAVVGTTAKQTFTLDFDTGSADLFVPGPQCGSSCSGNTVYNQKGVDEHNTTTVTYGSGMISGENYFDTVSVAGLAAKKTNVISLSTATGFSGSDAEGLMGMGFSTIANSGQPTYFENLIAQHKVTNPEFSFYLGRGADGTGDNSELALGGQDASKYTGAITKVPVTTKGYWQVKLDKVLVNGKSGGVTGIADPTPGQAAIDTGTTIVLAPMLATASIYSRVPGAFLVPVSGSTLEIYAYPCAQTPNVQIVFAGTPFAINKKDFSLGKLTTAFADFMGDTGAIASKLAGGQYCLGSIAGADLDPTQNLYVVGDTFLKNWYSIYNYNNYQGDRASDLRSRCESRTRGKVCERICPARYAVGWLEGSV